MKKIKKDSPMLRFILNPSNTRGEVIGRMETSDYLIDTCFTNDTGKYETYISLKNGNSGVVEIYENKKEAIKGHKKFVEKMKKSPFKKIKDIGFENWLFGK